MEAEKRGRTSEAERLRVLVLADEGMSERAIAREVFGDERYYARVGRIRRAIPRRALPEKREVSDVSWFLADVTVRQWRRLAEQGVLPALSALEAELAGRGFSASA